MTGVVAQAAVLDLFRAAADGLGGTALSRLLGGLPDEVPENYRLASPHAHLPLAVPVRCLHARDDDTVPFSQSVDYVQAARAAGADARPGGGYRRSLRGDRSGFACLAGSSRPVAGPAGLTLASAGTPRWAAAGYRVVTHAGSARRW